MLRLRCSDLQNPCDYPASRRIALCCSFCPSGNRSLNLPIQITSVLSCHWRTPINYFVTSDAGTGVRSYKMFSNLQEFYLYLSFLREFERRRMGSSCQQQLAQRTSGEHEHDHDRHRRHESGSSENVIVECVAKICGQYSGNRI